MAWHLAIFNTTYNASRNNATGETTKKLFQLLAQSKIETLSKTFTHDIEALGNN